MVRSRLPLALTATALLVAGRPALAETPAGRDPLSVAAAIDREIDRRLAEARVPASPPADDAEFLRRVTLDLTGRIPTLERTLAFLDDGDPKKRQKKIDELLASRDYRQHFATVWRNRLAPPNPVNNKPQRDTFTPWLADQLNRGRGWHEVVADLLTVEGDIAKNPQSAFVMANAENFQPRASLLAASTARLFLGVQLRCAECHDHPFAPWKQADFWATAAFFVRLRNTSKKGPPFILTEEPEAGTSPAAAITLPSGAGKAAGQVVRARFPGGGEPAVRDGAALRPAFVAWLTAADNRYFAPALANRTWAHFFGRGLVNPVDDLRDDNPASHPALLALLADECRASGFDLKHLARCVCNSQAYQRTSRPRAGNERDAELLSHAAVRPISAEAFYDSLSVVYSPYKSGKFAAPGAKAPRLEPRDDFVRFFRAQGEAAAEGGINQGIPQFLRRLNAETFNQGSPLVAYLVHKDVPRREAVELLYLAMLSRHPTADEVDLMSDYVGRRGSAAEGYAGVVWVLLNTGEFVLNH
jgi:hypothetical protein